jgi:plastocyanin
VALLRPAFLALAGALAAGLPAAPLAAGAIRGRVDVRLEWPALETAPRVGELGMPQPHDVPDRRRSVVYLEAGPLGAFEDLERREAFLDQKNEAFYPYVLAVQAGTTVYFPNNDRTYHNVFSLSKAKRFDLGRYPRGQVKTVTFDRPGVVRVFCDIHSHMSAFILVFTHPFFTTTDVDGRYRIQGLPAGTYTVAVWTDGAVRETRKVEVPPGDGVVEADFVVK